MKAALLIVLSLSAMAFAGPALNKNNQIDSNDSIYNKQQQQNLYVKDSSSMVAGKGPVVDILKQWCFSSQMSQQELTASFKKLVGVIKSKPVDQSTEVAVMNGRICSNAVSTKQTGTETSTGVDAQAHELIKDVYMDALIACKSRDSTKQLLKIIQEQSYKVDPIRASYYMTRLAVTEKDQIKDIEEIKQLTDSLIQQQPRGEQSESVERQKLFAVTSMVGKYCQDKPTDSQAKQIAQDVAKTIVERYLSPVSQQEVQQYQQQADEQQVSEQLIKKIAKRNVALKALANLPGHVLKEIPEVEQKLMSIVQDKQELSLSRQSAIECLEQNAKAQQMLKQLCFDQEEPIEVRVAAYRALMTVVYSVDMKEDDQQKQQVASQIIDELIKHCEDSRNQQQDDQFVMYVISHLDNVRTSQQPEHQAVKECIVKNKQHYMQIQVLCKKFKQQLSDVRRSSRNYKLEQEFNQIESGLILHGDIIYESEKSLYSKTNNKQVQILPKLVRVNMSMPVMGETVNVVEITIRQNQMDEEILSALKLVQNTKFTSESVSKVVDSFKSSVENKQKSTGDKKAVEADLTIKVDGRNVVCMTIDDFKTSSRQQHQHQRNTRSVYSKNSIVDDVIEYLKRSPVAFNRGINFNLNERIAKLLDVEANLIAGLRFESRAQGPSSDNFEIVAKVEPRFNFEAIVGPAKMSSKKLLQRLSTKTAVGLRLRFKRDELVDVQIDLPMQSMELFTVESQIVEKSSTNKDSYNYLPESIYGQEDIYSTVYPSIYDEHSVVSSYNKYTKRSIFQSKDSSYALKKLLSGKPIKHSLETPERFARATGLSGKLHFLASPKDMSFIVSCLVEKYEPSMQGVRVVIQKNPSQQQQQKSYIVTVSTPGSRIERNMQLSLLKQSSSQRTLIKSEIQVADKLSGSFVTEIVHDGRQYSVKTELVSRRSQWRHFAEFGVVVAGGSKSPSGRLAQFAFKPYVQIESTSLKRPIQLQGTIAYSQSPKSVISYELKCQISGDYIQGKLIVDQRDVSGAFKVRQSSYRLRRSMQSPLELVLSKDLTLTNELVAQVRSHAVKVHNMIDWDAQKIALQADNSYVYKNTRKSTSQSVMATFKLDAEQQLVVVERKSPEDERKSYRATIKSEWRAPSSHQMVAELRYTSSHRSQQQEAVVYRHNVDISKIGQKQYDFQMQVELIDSERQLNEKLSGRARVSTERKQKSIQAELSRKQQQLAKIQFDYESLNQHQIVVFVQTKNLMHKCELRNNQRQFAVVSRTDKHGQTYAKFVVELDKNQPSKDCKIVVEVPVKRLSVAADLKLASGQRSSMAIQTPRFVSQGEFSFETIARPFLNTKFLQSSSWFPKKSANLRFRQQIKDLDSKQAYWMDSQINGADWDKETSYFRFDSPIYRTDLEFDPRDQTTKFGAFSRSKRSVNSYDSIYSNKDSSLNDLLASSQLNSLNDLAKLTLGKNKLWMLRAVMSSPFAREQLKEQARRAFVQYADREQSHKHSFEYSPRDSRFNFDLQRAPNTDFSTDATFEPMRLKADLSSSFERPSTMSLESEWMNMDIDAKPFDEEDSYARISALSRHRRSPFKQHESEWRYKKDQGHKAWMKHVDAKNQRHSVRAETENDPKRWAKMNFESDKHGKANWEHKWRKHVEKRSSSQQDDEQVYANKVNFRAEGPSHKGWMHQTDFDWQEPISMVEGRRHRRSIVDGVYADNTIFNRYSPTEYLKHTSARLSSSYGMRPITGNVNSFEPIYKLDFDYKPQLNSALLDVQMPGDMQHTSSVEMKPNDNLYKLKSKLYNRATQEPIYDFSALTKPFVSGLATAEQEPVFVHSEHPMLERPISTSSLAYNLFKQPMKLDYSDKYGRQASFDYDQLPIASQMFAGLRQKRAAVFYKDSDNDFEHSSSYDFYPETFLGRMKPNSGVNFNERQRYSDNLVVVKTQTKYGPLVVRADTSDADNMQCELESPVANVKLSAETGANMRKLIKFHLDNKSQRVQLAKLLRKAPETIRNLRVVDKVARKIDSSRLEHDTELLVSIVDSIFKVKSSTSLNSRPVVVVDGEWNEQQGKAYAKINGERVNGQCAIDLVRKSAELVFDATNKHGEPIKHATRIVRTSDNFYTIESSTSSNSRPLFKLIGKISSMVFEEPAHLFAGRRHGASQTYGNAHVSTFEAFLYKPKQYHITGVYDCDKREARIVGRSQEENKIQETIVRFDDNTNTLMFDSRLSSDYEGQVYQTKAKLSLEGLFNTDKCYKYGGNFYNSPQTINGSCSSELIYEDKSGYWTAKYQPGDYVAVSTPRGKQTFRLGY